MPRGQVDKRATEVTGLAVYGGRLHHRGNPVITIPLAQLLTSFLDFLQSVPGPVLLVAHNAKGFDWVVLTRVLQQFPLLLSQFQRVVPAYLDTLPLSKRIYPELPSHSLSSLADYFLGKSFNAHNAVKDALMLQELFFTWNLAKSTYSEFITAV